MNATQNESNETVAMFDAEIYNQNHDLQTRDVNDCLNKYTAETNWFREGARIIDIGSGDGSTTANVLTKYIPKNYEELIGGDMSEDMVMFSNKHYAGGRVSFIKLDIEKDLPMETWENFDHVVSFYAFHWVQNQRKAFTNVHKMLNKGGSCLILLAVRVPFFDLFINMSNYNRWSAYVKNPNKHVSPYNNSKFPIIEVEDLMKEVGFKNISVKTEPGKYLYKDRNDIYNFIKGVNPFRVPNDQLEEYLNDCVKVFMNLPCVHVHKGTGTIEMDYLKMFALGSK